MWCHYKLACIQDRTQKIRQKMIFPRKIEWIVCGQSSGVDSLNNITRIDFENEQNGNVAG